MLASLGTHTSRTASRIRKTAALTGSLQFTATAFGPMSGPQLPQRHLDATLGREVVACHACQNEWYRDEQPTLECPRCLGEITENVAPENDPRALDDGYDSDSNPDAVDIDQLHYGSGFFNNRTLRPGGSAHHGDPQADALRRFAPIMNGFHREGWESLPAVSGVPAGRSGPLRFDAVFADFMVDPPEGGDNGDAVYSQEALDRIISQLIPQSSKAPPASEESIAKLGKRKVGIEDLGSDGKVECVICVEELHVGDEVTVLPCKHWFHGDCVTLWLKEHNTCPICRTPIETDSRNNRQGDQQQQSV
ncbi:hypothetical protein GE09DRAFT_1161704 [Coniochaeta sp. 2T2.1]|nr:hypothetical protein GE09DRAFT_1161704 [Coniochaeta sp. 2T2.1]